MKIEVNLDETVIRNAIQTWVDRSAANALDAYLNTEIVLRINEMTKAAVNKKLNELTKHYDFTPNLDEMDITFDGVVEKAAKYTNIYVTQWAKREATKAATAALKREAKKLATAKGAE